MKPTALSQSARELLEAQLYAGEIEIIESGCRLYGIDRHLWHHERGLMVFVLFAISRMVEAQLAGGSSLTRARGAIAKQLGVHSETLRTWLRRAG